MKKIKITFITNLFLFLIMNQNNAQEPNFEWAIRMGAAESDWGEVITVDEYSNIYTAGTFKGSVDFDPGPDSLILTAVEASDIFIQKLDPVGNLIWARHLGGEGVQDQCFSITTDHFGNVYTTGRFGKTVDFDPGPDTFLLSSVGFDDIFIQKLDSLGDFVWAKQIGGISGDIGFSIATDEFSNVYVTGKFEELVDFDPGPDTLILDAGLEDESDIFILKLTESGSLDWVKQIGGSNDDFGRSIVLDNAGNIYIAGGFSDTVDFDTGPDTFNLSSTGWNDFFVLKLDNVGNFAWVKQILKGIGANSCTSMTVDEVGNIYITGDFKGTVDFDPGPDTLNLISEGLWDIYVQKLDFAGNLVWVKQMSGSGSKTGYCVTFDASNNVYITGSFRDSVDFDPGPNSMILVSFDDWDGYIQKLSSSGDLVWVKQIGGEGNDRGQSIAVDDLGNIYVTGFIRNIVDFDPGVDTFNLNSAGGYDIFIYKLSNPPLGIEELKNEIGVLIYPNPTFGFLQIDRGNNQRLKIHIFDNFGRLIIHKNSEDQITRLDLNNCSSGIYYLLINNGVNTIAEKIVKL